VVHESALPKGKGWSPLTWQILEGKSKVPITLFEAELSVDSGEIYFQKIINFEGHELVDELRKAQGEATIELALSFVDAYPRIVGKKQKGKATFYPRRRPADSELDPRKSIKSLFNQLRVADNERYPAFFRHKGNKYVLKIYKENEE
jgi:methionyl-tRNA formyltransferase